MKINRLGWLTLLLAACLGIWGVLLTVVKKRLRVRPNPAFMDLLDEWEQLALTDKLSSGDCETRR